jgi:putative nucleotidyltransferase with HDIG domain
MAAPVPPAPADSPPAGSCGRKKRLLFVEGDAVASRDLSRLLEPLRDQWDMVFTANPAEALAALEREPFDAVVAALGLTGMTGVGFLNDAVKHRPQTLRFIRCTPQERKDLKGFVGTAPQHFSTELDAEGAQLVIKRAFLVDDWFTHEAIKTLLAKLHKMPTLPTLYTQILHELQAPDVAIDSVARLIAKDPVMTAKMLQLVNSAYFALPREVTDPVEAVMFLGAERTRSLILLAKVFSQFDKHQCEGFHLEELWRHSLAVGSYAHLICQTERKDTRLADQAFTAGLLHDIGKLLLAGNLPEPYGRVLDQAQRRKLPPVTVEAEVFGATHAELGACLLGTWGLPLGILEAIAWHHRPTLSEDKEFSLLTAVHAANAIDHEKRAEAADILVSRMDPAYIQRLDLGGRRNRWRELCESPTKAVDEVSEKN